MQRVLTKKLPDGKFTGVPAARSKTMRAIRSTKNRSTEKRLRACLVRAGLKGWTIHPPEIPGTPEFYFPEARLAVFTDGCHWHGCPRCFRLPTTNRPYWKKKIDLNRERDRRDDAHLAEAGCRVLRFWEHELRESPTACVDAVRRALEGG